MACSKRVERARRRWILKRPQRSGQEVGGDTVLAAAVGGQERASHGGGDQVGGHVASSFYTDERATSAPGPTL
jgi:hypothetical protein